MKTTSTDSSLIIAHFFIIVCSILVGITLGYIAFSSDSASYFIYGVLIINILAVGINSFFVGIKS